MANADVHFGSLGIQYYTAGRCAFLARLSPVAANLLHHAVEMLLKSRLSESRTLKELSQKPFGHRLLELWAAFKADFQTEELDEFDMTLRLLDKFEDLRYPDSVLQRGAAILFQYAPSVPASSTGTESFATPSYTLVLNDIDRLVARIFKVCSRNPPFYTSGMNRYAQDALLQDNPEANFILPPASRTYKTRGAPEPKPDAP